MEKVEQIAEDIRTMKVQGAIQIAMLAEEGLRSVVQSSKARTIEEFYKELENAAELLKKTRPTAVALPNAVDIFIERVKAVDGDLGSAKKFALDAANNMIKEMEESLDKIGKAGAELIKEGDTVLEHCHSSTVIAVLKEAHKQGRNFKVICTETRPWGQGYISAKEISNAGIPTSLIVDSAAMRFMKDVNLVIVGADTITKNGDVVNKIGTSQIALVAKHFNVPFYVATQTLKYDKTKESGEDVPIEERAPSEIIEPAKLPNVDIKNPIFDITKPGYITGYITEKGLMKQWEK
jgi:ribose 1,5-bisphosphate isomerase